MYLPMPHEVVDRYLGEGEQKIHTNHPSFRAFLMTNGVLVLVLLFATALFLTVFSNGSMMASAAIGLVVLGVGAVLFGKRLREAYTSYVITNVRIMRLSGVLSRNVHSVPLGRITDLTIEQGLVGRVLGYATVHIESMSEESGLRDLRGVIDPIRFHSYLVDIVVAKQGALARIPVYPPSGSLRQRVQDARDRVRRRRSSSGSELVVPGDHGDAERHAAAAGGAAEPRRGAGTATDDQDLTEVSDERAVIEYRTRPTTGDAYYADRRQVIIRPGGTGDTSPASGGGVPAEDAEPVGEAPAEEGDDFLIGFRRAGGDRFDTDVVDLPDISSHLPDERRRPL